MGDLPGNLTGREGDGRLRQSRPDVHPGARLHRHDAAPLRPQTKLWSIYWSDTKSHKLFPPTIGTFENGRGEFFGDDVEGGKPVRVRFDWTGGASPRWEQSFSTDGGKSWELNWVMKFERG